VGYSNFWGNTDTQIISYRIDVDWKSEDENGNQVDRSWQGTVDVQVSEALQRSSCTLKTRLPIQALTEAM